MSNTEGDQTNSLATSDLSKTDRQRIQKRARETAEREVNEYTTVGELRGLATDVVQSQAIRGGIAAPFEAKRTVAVQALAEYVRDEITQGP